MGQPTLGSAWPKQLQCAQRCDDSPTG